MRYLRFDMKRTRSQRLQSDKFALASEVWQRFSATYLGRILLQMSNSFHLKPGADKFGIKFWMLVDNDTKDLCNAFPYLGKDELRSANESLPERVVMRLMSPYFNKGRNVITDKFFTSARLARTPKANDTSIVGTISRTRREIPAVLAMKRAPLHETTLLRNGDGATSTIYQGKFNKNVRLLNTLHSTIDIETNRKTLRKTVQFYNKTKFGVDILDQMARRYSTKAAARRWSVHVFYSILDLAAINAWIIYRGVTGEEMSRHAFLRQLAEELREVYKEKRESMFPKHNEEEKSQDKRKASKSHQCQVGMCERSKTTEKFEICFKYVCGKCTKTVDKKFRCKKCTL